MTAHSVEHNTAEGEPVFDPVKQRLARMQEGRRRRDAVRKRLRALQDEELAAFGEYMTLAASVDAPESEVRALRSRAWDLGRQLAHEKSLVDAKLWPRPVRTRRPRP